MASITSGRGGLLGTRWFYLLAAALLAGTVYGMATLAEHALRKEVEAATEAANNTFTRVLVNNNWTQLRPMLGLDRADGRPQDNPQLPEIDRLVRTFAKGTDLVKVKVYNARGLTIYSSDPRQIGEDKSSNAGFQAAARGVVATEMNYRGKFGAFDGEIYDRNLVSSYVPVRGQQGVEAVVEVYTDRTPSIQAVESRSQTLAGGLTLGMLVLFGSGLWIHRRQRAAIDALEQTLLRLSAHSGPGPDGAPHPPDTLTWQACADAATHLLSGPGVDDLARLAHLQTSPAGPRQDLAPVGALTGQALQALRVEAQARGVAVLEAITIPADARVRDADGLALADVLRRVLSAGLQQTRAGGTLQVKIQHAPGHLEIDVIGSGDAVDPPVEAAARLSLAVAQAAARRLGGELRHEARPLEGGIVSQWVAVHLPWQIDSGADTP